MAQPISDTGSSIQTERKRIAPDQLLDQVEGFRLHANRRLQPDRKAAWGQFLTPAPVAHLMASAVTSPDERVHILDAGAGVGTLFAALVSELISRDQKPAYIIVTAIERDETMATYTAQTLKLCEAACHEVGVIFP